MAELTTNINYLQPTSFKITIDRKNFPNLEFFCQDFTHPGMIMNSVEVPYKKIQAIPFIGDKLTFNELLANIILDNNENSRLESQGLRPPSVSDITLSILSSHNNQTKQVKYIDCMPTALTDIQFQSTATGTEFITFGASFRFSYFELV